MCRWIADWSVGSLDNLHLVGWLELVLHLLNAKLFRVANEKLMARLDIQMRLLALDYGVHLEMPFQGRNQPVLLSRSLPVSLSLSASFHHSPVAELTCTLGATRMKNIHL